MIKEGFLWSFSSTVNEWFCWRDLFKYTNIEKKVVHTEYELNVKLFAFYNFDVLNFSLLFKLKRRTETCVGPSASGPCIKTTTEHFLRSRVNNSRLYVHSTAVYKDMQHIPLSNSQYMACKIVERFPPAIKMKLPM